MAVPAVDTRGSEIPTHLLVNVKKLQMKKELQAHIEKQNIIHSNKLSAIRQSHGRLDNWNFYPQHSLNVAQQRQNLNKISYENGKILERILRRESEYGRRDSEWEKVKQIQANISRYPQVTWAGQQRVTFMDYKSNTDIHHLVEGSETDSIQSRSTQKLEGIPKRSDHRRKKEHLIHTDNRKQLTPIQAKDFFETRSEDKAHCISGHVSPYRWCKRGTVISATSEKADCKDQAKSASRDQKSFSKSKNDAKCFAKLTSGDRGQDEFTEGKDGSQEECMNEKSQPGNEPGTKLKNERKTPKSYKGFNPQEESDASSFYSFQGSEESSSSCCSRSTVMSGTLSSVSINLKTRLTGRSSTSLRSIETPVRSSHNVKFSNTQNVYRGHDPSSQESSTNLTSPTHPETPVTSFQRLEFSNRQNAYSISPLESEKSNNLLPHSTNRITEHSERVANSSPESFVIYPQKWPI